MKVKPSKYGPFALFLGQIPQKTEGIPSETGWVSLCFGTFPGILGGYNVISDGVHFILDKFYVSSGGFT